MAEGWGLVGFVDVILTGSSCDFKQENTLLTPIDGIHITKVWTVNEQRHRVSGVGSLVFAGLYVQHSSSRCSMHYLDLRCQYVIRDLV